jgi:translation initiation factor IF-2
VRVVGVRPQGSAEPRSEPDTPGSLRVEDADSESKDRREKALRRSKWIEDEEKDSVATSRGAGRKVARGGRREFDEDADEEEDARESFRARKAARQKAKEEEKEQRRKMARREREGKNSENATPITLPEFISVQQLSQQLGVRYEEFIERLEDLGYDDVFPGMTLNSEISGMIAMEFNFEPSFELAAREEEERDLKARPDVDDKEFLPVRPPVVTIMGHVDHGKTTILDYLRKSSVAAGEAGGITQHIGAFSVPLASSGRTITFLDTPGHAAFLAMRQRGANVTDIVILVVAADDSVKPQTLEAIKHAKAAGVPMIVAVNKVDKEDANVDRVKQDLARHGVEIEDYGGDTQVVPVSGKTGLGMDDLEENIVTLSEILDHRAETDGPVEGWVLEATTKKAGRVATVLVRRGTLRPGAVLVAGRTWARVRTLRNEGGQNLSEIGPGMPIEVDGWKDQPMAGDEVLQAPSEQKATSVVEYRTEIHEREKAAKDIEAINEARKQAVERQAKEKAAEQASKQAQRAAVQEGGAADVAKSPDDLDRPEAERTGQIVVPFVIKADVSGSAEAVSAYIMSVSHPLVAPSILRVGVGEVHESDIELAAVAHGYIIAFNLPSDPETQGLAESKGVRVLENNIIYRVLDDVKAVLEDKLPPIVSQRVLGEAEVSIPFEIGVGGRKKMKIAGCKVRNGLVKNNSRVRVMRGSKKVYDGESSRFLITLPCYFEHAANGVLQV